MEPRSAERGNVFRTRTVASRPTASMEPRSAERGNGATEGAVFDPDALQWSHAQPNVETII